VAMDYMMLGSFRERHYEKEFQMLKTIWTVV